MAEEFIARTKDQSVVLDLLNDFGIQGHRDLGKPGWQQTGLTKRRNRQRITEAERINRQMAFTVVCSGKTMDEVKAQYDRLTSVFLQDEFEIVNNYGSVGEESHIFDCYGCDIDQELPIDLPADAWTHWPVLLEPEARPYSRSEGLDLPENLIVDPLMSSDSNADGICDSFSEFHDVVGNATSLTVDLDGGQSIQVNQFAGASGGEGVQTPTLPVAFGTQISLEAEYKAQTASGDARYNIDFLYTEGEQKMGINIGNDISPDLPYPTAQVAADLTFMAGSFHYVRVALPWYNNATAVAQMRQLALDAKSHGLHVIYGVTSGTTLTAANWATYHTAVVAEAVWAQANGIDEFQVGNELNAQIDGTTLTAAPLRANIRQLATDVKTAGYAGKVSYAEAGGYDNNSQGWADDNTIGGLDYFGLNNYGAWASTNISEYDHYLTVLQAASFAANVYISEYNVCTDWPGLLGAMTTDQITEAIKVRRNLNGVDRMYFFAWRFGGDQFAVKKADGTLMQSWWEVIKNRPTQLLAYSPDATGWVPLSSLGIAVPYGRTGGKFRAWIHGSSAGAGQGQFTVANALLAKTPIDPATSKVLPLDSGGNPPFWTTNVSSSPAHLRVKRISGNAPALLLAKHQAPGYRVNPARYWLGCPGKYDQRINNLIFAPLWRGFIWQSPGSGVAAGGEIKINLGGMKGRFVVLALLSSSSTTLTADQFNVNLYSNPNASTPAMSNGLVKPFVNAGSASDLISFGEIELPIGGEPDSGPSPANSLGLKSGGGNGTWGCTVIALMPLNGGSYRLDPVTLLTADEYQAVQYDGESYRPCVYLERQDATPETVTIAVPPGNARYVTYYDGYSDYTAHIISVNMTDKPVGATFSAFTNGASLSSESGFVRKFNAPAGAFYVTITAPAAMPFALGQSRENIETPFAPDLITVEPVIENLMVGAIGEVGAYNVFTGLAQKIFMRVTTRFLE